METKVYIDTYIYTHIYIKEIFVLLSKKKKKNQKYKCYFLKLKKKCEEEKNDKFPFFTN